MRAGLAWAANQSTDSGMMGPSVWELARATMARSCAMLLGYLYDSSRNSAWGDRVFGACPVWCASIFKKKFA